MFAYYRVLTACVDHARLREVAFGSTIEGALPLGSRLSSRATAVSAVRNPMAGCVTQPWHMKLKDRRVNSFWLVVTSLAAFVVAYRFYGAFLAARVAVLNDARLTPAHRLRDNVDYCPTRRLVLFGAHFAAIAGAGPLLGRSWPPNGDISRVHVDRRRGLSGGRGPRLRRPAGLRAAGRAVAAEDRRQAAGTGSGTITLVATLFIVIATLAGAGMAVVNALSEGLGGVRDRRHDSRGPVTGCG